MYNWSVILSRSDSSEYEILLPEDMGNGFKSKRNAQLFAESYVLNYIMRVDGINRLEPFIDLPSPSTPMKGLEVTREYITNIVKDSQITNLKYHYIVGGCKDAPWSLTVHRLHIFLSPVTITKTEERLEEKEVEEEQEIEVEKQIIVPGTFFHGRRTEKVKEKVKKVIKKQIPVQYSIDIVSQERTVYSTDVFTVSLLKTKILNHVDPVEREHAMMMANTLAKNFSETRTSKMIFAVADSDVPYKVSELKSSNEDEFGSYRLPEKKKHKSITPQPEEQIPSKPINIRKATNVLGIKTNSGAALAGLKDEILKKRNEMFKD